MLIKQTSMAGNVTVTDHRPISWADSEGGRVSPGNHKAEWFLSNIDPDPMEITKSAFNVGPLSARQRDAI